MFFENILRSVVWGGVLIALLSFDRRIKHFFTAVLNNEFHTKPAGGKSEV